MSVHLVLLLAMLTGVLLGGVLIAAAHGLGWLVGRAEEHRRMPPHPHEVDD